MKGFSDSIASELGSQGIIQKEDVDKCRYGLEIMMSSLLDVLSILLFSIFVGNFLETVLLFAAFIPLRIYAGGYHANTKLRCYLVSVSMYIVFTATMFLLPREFYWVTSTFCTIFSLIMVYSAAPIIHHNKTVNEIEKEYYRKFSRTIALLETALIFIITIIFPFGRVGISLALGQFAVSVSMMVATAPIYFKSK